MTVERTDLQPWRDVTVGTTIYKVWFSANAIRRLELAAGMGYEEFMARFVKGIKDEGSSTGFSELHMLLYAGLEGGRLKLFPRKPAWTMDSVGDLIDAHGGYRQVFIDTDLSRTLGQAMAAGMPLPKKEEKKPAPTKGDGAGADPPQDPGPDPSSGGSSS